MTRRTLGVAALLWLGLAAAALAQDEPVQLRYRFQPGQEFRYRLTINGDLAMTMAGIKPPPGANIPPRIPMALSGTYEWVQKVKSVAADGSATVSISLDKMEMTTGVMGMNIAMRLAPGGKLETLMNGQPMAMPPGAAPASLPSPLYEATISPAGKITGVSTESLRAMSQLYGGQNVAGMFNGGMPGTGLLLPEQPVKPGDTWNTKWDMTIPIPTPGPGGPAAGGGVAGTIPVSINARNRLAKVENGQATIETQVTTAVPAGMKLNLPQTTGAPPGMSLRFEKMDQSMSGAYRFGIEQGAIEGGDLDAKMDIGMAMGFPPGAPGMAPPAPAAGRTAPARATKSPRSRSVKPSARARASTPPAQHGSMPATAPAGLKIGIGGTMKLKIDRVAESP
jgi:hypothetical protein